MARKNPKKREDPVERREVQELKAQATRKLTPEEMEEQGIGELPSREDV
ncbi:MAG: hypothetical protein HY689_03515 [Chloroflexi bacterium]|nr:hypothetical protein [Chloroflexota bacterium]